MSAEKLDTYPHDYRVIVAGTDDVKPVVVGGQAVNLWAITYLRPTDTPLDHVSFGSGDMDVVSNASVLKFLKSLDGWRVESTPLRNRTDIRTATAYGVAPDGRHLLVEVLHSVLGLDASDMKAVQSLQYGGIVFHTLDPIALLKAKAANLRRLDQVGPPPRHDRPHLNLVAQCFPRFLSDLHAAAVENSKNIPAAAHAFSRAFTTLQHRPTATTLQLEGIPSAKLMPPEFAQSTIEKIRNAYKWQMPRLEQ